MIRGGSTLGLGRMDSGDAGRIDSGADRLWGGSTGYPGKGILMVPA